MNRVGDHRSAARLDGRPFLPAVSRKQDCAVHPDDDRTLGVERVNAEKLFRNTRILRGPRRAGVHGLQDSAVAAGDPARLQAFAGKVDRVKVIPRFDADQLPFFAPVRGR